MKLKRSMVALLSVIATGIIIGSIVFFTLSKEAILKASESKNMEKPNRLINEKSPYLLQHANNPVDWYPWGEEAFEKARKENKPFFAGTYFPKDSRFGRIGMTQLVPRIKEIWTTKRDEIVNSANKITSALQ